MKISVTDIYWILLLVSCVSSSVLFLLVASEGSTDPAQLACDEEINTTDGGNDITHQPGYQLGDDAATDPNTEANAAEIHSSFAEASPLSEQKAAPSIPDILRDAVSHNSGLVGELSDPGQVVLTIVDTATAELQNSADLSKATSQTLLSDETFREQNNHTSILNDIPLIPIKHSTSNLSDNLIEAVRVENVTAQPEQPHIVRAEPKVTTNAKETTTTAAPSSRPNKTPDENITEKEGGELEKQIPTVVVPPAVKQPETPEELEKREDIPSFAEWAQKQLEEAEKKKEVLNASAQNLPGNGRSTSNLKLRSKNYASPDCGAKIVAANAEATSAFAVLSSSRDEYMLNTCTSRIWFIVEMCEAVQAKKIELANFELFSSSPKEFSVSVSDRFPTRDWSSVGQFTAKDERDVQIFDLHPHLFGKYIKVELHSHYGAEHFCPVSLFRVFGTSEFEVLETEDEIHPLVDNDDDDFDETLNSDRGEAPSNLFGSARDAVISLVKKAAQVLVLTSDSTNRTAQRTVNCSLAKLPFTEKCQTPSHLIVCDNCSDLFFGNVFNLLSCQNDMLKKLSDANFISNALINTDVCVEYGLNFNSRETSSTSRLPGAVATAFLGPEYVAALCNIMAIREKKVVLNASNSLYSNITSGDARDVFNKQNSDQDFQPIIKGSVPSDDGGESSEDSPSQTIPETSAPSINTEPQPDVPTIAIQPTKTFTQINDQDTAIDLVTMTDTAVESSEPNIPIDTTCDNLSSKIQSSDQPSDGSVINFPEQTAGTTKQLEEETQKDHASDGVLQESERQTESSNEGFELGPEQFDSLLSEWEQYPNNNPVVTTTVLPPSSMPQQGQKESVFVRLYNRIKALERNMSLSSQYLEELSRRYKKQMEEMQRAFDRTLAIVNEESKKADEYRERNAEEMTRIASQLSSLTTAVELLMKERNSWTNAASWFMHFLITQLCIAAIIIYFCGKSDAKYYIEQVRTDPKSAVVIPKRRKSVDVVRHDSPAKRRRRRPSEEALNITGTYYDLLIPDITEIDGGPWKASRADKRRKRKKNSILRRSNSNGNLLLHNNKSVEFVSRSSSSEMPTEWGYSHVTHSEDVVRTVLPSSSLYNGFIVPSLVSDLSPESEGNINFNVHGMSAFSSPIKNTVRVQEPQAIGRRTKDSTKVKIVNPNFMKTATSERGKRISMTDISKDNLIMEPHVPSADSIDSVLEKSKIPHSTSNGIHKSSVSTEKIPIKKDKKSSGGFKKIFKKVF